MMLYASTLKDISFYDKTYSLLIYLSIEVKCEGVSILYLLIDIFPRNDNDNNFIVVLTK